MLLLFLLFLLFLHGSSGQTAPTFTLLQPLITVWETDGLQNIAAQVGSCMANDPGQDCTTPPAAVATSATPGGVVTGLSIAWPSGNLQFTPGAPGTTTVRVTVTDSGGDASAPQTFQIQVNPVNDPPLISYPKGTTETVGEDTMGTQTNPGFISADPQDPGQPSWGGMTHACMVTAGGFLFTTPPTVNPSGDLSYQLAPGVSGTASVSCTHTDNGPQAPSPPHNGQATSTFTILVQKDNDQPTVQLGGVACATAAAPCAAAPTIQEDAGPQTVAGFLVADTLDSTDTPLQTITRTDVTCIPLSYSCTGHPDCGTAIFAQPPSFTNCMTTGTQHTCDLSYTVSPDEFTEGLTPGEVTCTVEVQDSGGTAVCGGGVANCDRATAQFTIKVTPVNDPPTVMVTIPDIQVSEDCGCLPSTCPATPVKQASGIFPMGSVVAGPYNEIIFAKQKVVVAPGGIQVSDPTVFVPLPAGSNLNGNMQLTSPVVHITDTGDVFFTPAPHRSGPAPGPGNKGGTVTITATLQDDGAVPCQTSCACPGGAPCLMPNAQNPPLDTNTPTTFNIKFREVNDPPFVQLDRTVVNVPEDCGAQTFPNFIMEVTAGQGPYAPFPGPYPTQEERNEIVTLLDPTGPCPAPFMCLSKLELDPPEAAALFASVPTLDNTGPFSSNQRNTATLQFECAAGRSTTHPFHAPCGLKAPNFQPGGVPAPPSNGGGTLPQSPTGSVKVKMTFRDDGGDATCGDDTTVKEFDIVIHETNDPPSYTTRPVPALQIYEDSFGDDPGDGLECKSPLEADPHPCRPERPRELKIKDWLKNFTAGDYFEDQFESLTWILHPDLGQLFHDGPKIDQYQCPFVDDMKALRMTLEPHAVGTTNVMLDCIDSGIIPLKCGESFFDIQIMPVNDPPDACPVMDTYRQRECTDVGGCHLEIHWLNDINPGGGVDERHQKVDASCEWGPRKGTAGGHELFTGTASLDVHSGDLKITLQQWAQGAGWVVCVLEDDGGIGPAKTAKGDPCDMNKWTFRLDFEIAAVNQPPTWDVGSHTGGMDLSITEDSAQETFYGFATKVSPSGDPHEKDQKLHFECTADKPDHFEVQPSIALIGSHHTGNTQGDLTLKPAKDAYGLVLVTCSLFDDGSCTNIACETKHTFRVTISPVNDRPSVTFPNNPIVVPTDMAYNKVEAVPYWGADNEKDQTFTYEVKTPDNSSHLFRVPPEILPDGTLQFVTADVVGNVTVEVVVTDSGGDGALAIGDPVYLTIAVLPVNHAPSFTLSSHDVEVAVDGGVQYIRNFATQLSPGPGAHEKNQSLSFTVLGYDTTLFKEPLTITADGSLRVVPKATGVTRSQVYLKDDGPHCLVPTPSCRHVGESPVQSFVLAVTPASPMRFTPGDPVVIPEDHGAWKGQWATGIYGTGMLSFTCKGYDTGVFASPPAITPRGELSFEVEKDMNGKIQFEACLSNGLSSVCKVATILVQPVNDPPTFLLARDMVLVTEDAGPVALLHLVHGVSVGPIDERSNQTFHLSALQSCHGLFQAPPVFDDQGTLSFTVRPDTTGNCTVTVLLVDSEGGRSNRTLEVVVAPENDSPSFVPGGGVTWRTLLGRYSDPWASSISAGAGEVQNVTFKVSFDAVKAAELFTDPPTVHPNGTLTFTPRKDGEGTLEAFVTLTDDGLPPKSSETTPLVIKLLASGDYRTPVFTVPPETELVEDQVESTIENWCRISNLTEGYKPRVTASVQTGSDLFASPPTVTLPNCSLVLRLAPDAEGVGVVSFEFADGVSTIQASTRVKVLPVNDRPRFTVPEEHRLLHVVSTGSTTERIGYLRDITAGSPREDVQQDVRFVVLVGAASFFDAPPVVSSDGRLTFSIPRGRVGSVQLRITLHDTGDPPAVSREEVLHIASSGVKREVGVTVEERGRFSPLAYRKAVADLLQVPISRVAVDEVQSAGDRVNLRLSFTDPDPGVTAAPEAQHLLETFTATPRSLLQANTGTVGVRLPEATPPPSQPPTPLPPRNNVTVGEVPSDNSPPTGLILLVVAASLLMVGGVCMACFLVSKRHVKQPASLSSS